MNFASERASRLGTRVLAKFKKRDRYKYSGFTNQQKYNRKAESSQVIQYFVRKSKTERPCGIILALLRRRTKLLVFIHLGATRRPSTGPGDKSRRAKIIAVDYLGAIVAAVAEFSDHRFSMNAPVKTYATQHAQNRAPAHRADGGIFAIYAA